MKIYKNLVDYFEEQYDFDRIIQLSDKDKLKLLDYIKLVHKSSEVVKMTGLSKLQETELYRMDHSFHFLISIVHANLDSKIIAEIIENYAYNFYDSDVYYAKMFILGSGSLMIKEGIDSKSIRSYQLSLLGKDFLVRYDKIVREPFEAFSENNHINIRYRDLDMTFRKLKYDFLALLKVRKEYGRDKVSEIINEKYDVEELKVIFNLLNCDDLNFVETIYQRFMLDEPRMTRLFLTASRCIIKDYSIIETHYLFNSIIGKYSRIDKPYEEVLDEIIQREKEILSL